MQNVVEQQVSQLSSRLAFPDKGSAVMQMLPPVIPDSVVLVSNKIPCDVNIYQVYVNSSLCLPMLACRFVATWVWT